MTAAERIKQALNHVHTVERGVRNPTGLDRVEAAESAIRAFPDLATWEVDVLLNAILVERSELSIQF